MITPTLNGYFKELLELRTYKHFLYFILSWLPLLAVIFLAAPTIFIGGSSQSPALLPSDSISGLLVWLLIGAVGTFFFWLILSLLTLRRSRASFFASHDLLFLVFGVLFIFPALLWLLVKLLDFERWRAKNLLGAQILAKPKLVHKNLAVWFQNEVFSATMARGIAFLLLHSLFAALTLIGLGAMLYLTFILFSAPLVAAWQPASTSFSMWRDSVVWTGSEGLKFTAWSSAVAFVAGIPMLILTALASNAVARVWRTVTETAFSNDKSATRAVQALEQAASSVLTKSTHEALHTILEQGLAASSATGAAIGEIKINFGTTDLEHPNLLRFALEQNAELLAAYTQPASSRDTNLWQALGTHASTALKLEQLLGAERIRGSEEERARIARELHDSVAQALYGIALGTRSALEQLETSPEHAKRALEYAIDLADGGTAEMKTLLFALRPDALEEGGLAAALHKLGEMLLARYKLEAIVTAPLEPDVLLEVKGALYRIAQEAAHNTVKHAKAKQIWIRLESGVLEISDNGMGFDATAPRAGGIGLKSMTERASSLGAVLEVRSSSTGTSIVVQFGGIK